MIVKVCGITDNKNLQEICSSGIEMIGINCYAPSKRYIGTKSLDDCSAKRVGVFVNASIDEIKESITLHGLDIAQLHGDESPEFCLEVQKVIPIIKVFRVDKDFDWEDTKRYNFANFFLFDTKTIEYGGSGVQFDWSILDNYKLEIPFFLSGGIGPKDADSILSLEHNRFIGVDINSRFETHPGFKDVNLVNNFLQEIRP